MIRQANPNPPLLPAMHTACVLANDEEGNGQPLAIRNTLGTVQKKSRNGTLANEPQTGLDSPAEAHATGIYKEVDWWNDLDVKPGKTAPIKPHWAHPCAHQPIYQFSYSFFYMPFHLSIHPHH